MMKKRPLLITLSSLLFIGFLFGLAAPWGIGMALHHTIHNQLKKLEKHPSYRFVLKKYEQSMYRSRIAIEVKSKSLYQGAPKVQFVIEQDIQHGPIIFNLPGNQLWFVLAKINSRILPQDTAFIQFDQKDILLSSFVNYRWKENCLTQIDNITGNVFLLENKPCKLEIRGMEITGAFGFSTVNFLENAAIKEISFSLSSGDTVTFNQVKLNKQVNDTPSLANNYEKHLNCASVDITIKKHKINVQNPVLHLSCRTTAQDRNHLLDIQFQFNLEKIAVDDKAYGPLQAAFLMPHVPKMFTENVDKLETIVMSHNLADMREFFKTALQQENLELTLQKFHLHIPGGILALTGNLTLIPKENDIFPFSKEGVLSVHIPKYAPKIFHTLLVDDSCIEVDDMLTSHFVLKKNKLYINGHNPNDPLFAKTVSVFKQPLTKEQKLYIALLASDNKAIQDLVKEQVNLAVPIAPGKYPIHLAAYMGNREAIKLFLAQGVPVDLVDENGNTALYWAARAGHDNCLRALLDSKAAVNVKNRDGWTPLQEASENGHSNIVAALLAEGTAVNAQDNEGRTALFWAAKEGHVDIIQLLLHRGADPCLHNVRNLRPLDIAIAYKRQAAITELQNCTKCQGTE